MPRCALLAENGLKDTMLCETWSSNGPTVQGCAPRKSPPGSYCPSALTTLWLPVVALRMSIFLPWPGDLLHLTSPLRRHSDRKPLPGSSHSWRGCRGLCSAQSPTPSNCRRLPLSGGDLHSNGCGNHWHLGPGCSKGVEAHGSGCGRSLFQSPPIPTASCCKSFAWWFAAGELGWFSAVAAKLHLPARPFDGGALLRAGPPFLFVGASHLCSDTLVFVTLHFFREFTSLFLRDLYNFIFLIPFLAPCSSSSIWRASKPVESTRFFAPFCPEPLPLFLLGSELFLPQPENPSGFNFFGNI